MRRDAALGPRAARRWALAAWPFVQSALAATIAWFAAADIVGHPDPFFAPIAAVVALNTSVGERGRNAVRLVLGVGIGIVAGEIALAVVGSGTLALGIGTLAAMAAARALGGARIVLAQAASAAILTVATGEHIGPDRLTDALIGAGVALVFTQLLFSPEPMRLLRRVESAVLLEMGAALELTARALRSGDASFGEQAMTRHRALRDRLSELARVREAGVRTARHSVVWRSSTPHLVQEGEDAGHLDLLAGSALFVTRTTLAAAAEAQRLAPAVESLSAILGDLAKLPGDRPTRQAAADRALALIPKIDATGAQPGSPHAAAITALQASIVDLLIVAGVDADEARVAVREGSEALETGAPPSAPGPFRWLRRLARTLGRRILHR